MGNPVKVRHRCKFWSVNGKLVELWTTIVSEKVSPTEIEYRVAYCSPKDQFKKKEGVRVANASDKVYRVSVREDDTYMEISFAIFADMIKNRHDAPKYHRQYLDDMFLECVYG